MAVVGIDLGTTYSVIAHQRSDGEVEVLPNREGQRTTASVVFFDGEEAIVGEQAARAGAQDPENMVAFVKRQMGNKSWSFLAVDDRSYAAEEVSSLILKRLVEDAAAALGEAVEGAVITVPAYFNDAQRTATRQAGEMIGLKVLQIINEPTAAALCYAHQQRQRGKTDSGAESKPRLVFDLGGGTFDVTILRAGEIVEVLATGGDRNLGGFDWDNKISEHLTSQLIAAGASEEDLEEPRTVEAIRSQAKLLKHTLSSRDNVPARLTVGGTTLKTQVTREEVATLTDDLLQRTLEICEMVLEDATLSPSDLGEVLLVGGSTRMFNVAPAIEGKFRVPVSHEVHPDEAVAIGAAILARRIADGSLSGSREAQPNIEDEDAITARSGIADVNAHSLGTLVVDDKGRHRNSIILPRNTKLGRSSVETFSTVKPGQRQVRVEITEGEDEDPDYVELVGEGIMNLPPTDGLTDITIEISHNASGVVVAVARLANTGESLGEVVIERKANMTDDQLRKAGQKMDKVQVI